MLEYKAIEIMTSEQARFNGKVLSDAIVQYISSLKIAARCIVHRGTDGCYEGGEISTRRIEVLSYNMPVQISILLPASEFECVLIDIEQMVSDGIIAVRDVEVVAHKAQGRMLPRHIRVRDAMTPNPRAVSFATPLNEVAELLLSSIFTGVPVVDEGKRPVGIITQGDLIYRAGMPMRLGLLAASDQGKKGAVLDALARKKAHEAMSSPAVTIEEDSLLTDAVAMMLDRKLKRLPVVNDSGKLTGMLSRLDVFRTIMRESPDWKAFRNLEIDVGNLSLVSDIMRRDTHIVHPDTPVDDVIRIIDSNDIERVAVVGEGGEFLGLVSDQNLIVKFLDLGDGIWDYIVGKIPFTERGRRYRALQERLQARVASEVMDTDTTTVEEDASIDEAIVLMVERGLKRLPVVDRHGRFRGMISRDSLLRTAFACQSC